MHREKKKLGKKVQVTMFRAKTGVGKNSDDYHVYMKKKEMNTKQR